MAKRKRVTAVKPVHLKKAKSRKGGRKPHSKKMAIKA